MDDKLISELKAKHGERLVELSAAGATVVVKPPSRVQYKAFRSRMADDRRKVDAPEQLLRECVVHPAAADLDALFDRLPALVETFSVQLLELAGLSGEVEKKDL